MRQPFNELRPRFNELAAPLQSITTAIGSLCFITGNMRKGGLG